MNQYLKEEDLEDMLDRLKTFHTEFMQEFQWNHLEYFLHVLFALFRNIWIPFLYLILCVTTERSLFFKTLTFYHKTWQKWPIRGKTSLVCQNAFNHCVKQKLSFLLPSVLACFILLFGNVLCCKNLVWDLMQGMVSSF